MFVVVVVVGGCSRGLGMGGKQVVWGAAAPQSLEGKDAGVLGGGSPRRFRGNIGGEYRV